MSKNNYQKPSNTGKKQIIYGLHAVKAALLNDKRNHYELLITENHQKLADNYKSKIQKITFLHQKEFQKMYGSEKSTQGIILKTNDFERPNLQQFIKNENLNHKSVLLALDQITDPQNIGSIMRSCALFNCKGIIVAKDNAPDLTPSLYKAASGAAEIVNYFKVTNLKRSISELKKTGYWAYGFDSSNNENYQNIINELNRDQHTQEKSIELQKAFIKYNDKQDQFRSVDKTWRQLLPDLDSSLKRSINI